MAFWRLITLAFAISILVDAKLYTQKRHVHIANICNPTYSNESSIQCYCGKDPQYKDIVRSAECHLTKKDVEKDDSCWDGFENIKNATKLTLSNIRGIAIEFIPTNAIKLMQSLKKVEIKYGNIETIDEFAFANLSLIEEITLSDNQIKILGIDAFANLKKLSTLGLDSNNIVEINRYVFVDLPSLKKLFLTNNKITTIHDRAFIKLENLTELELDRNSIFSLNSETFSGLKNLEKLDLSGNSLEVIGDNTFLPLNNLQSLNLDGNKIQMVDEDAFNGLSKLYALSLARNNLINIENAKTFEGLPALAFLSLKSNQLVELKFEVMAPILTNFYGNTSSNLDVEDNKFPCDCRLDWFMALMNTTQNNRLKLAIENLKCIPSDSLREQWNKTAEQEKTTSPAFEDEPSPSQNTDYEYYDDAQLNGKLFYLDVRDLVNCTTLSVPTIFPEKTTTKDTTSSQTTKKPETTKATVYKPNKENETKNKDTYTTVRLVTVSAKPLEQKAEYDHDKMASDEARPEKIKSRKSIDDEKMMQHNNGHVNVGTVIAIAIALFFLL